MSKIVRSVLAVVAGAVLGSMVNMFLINLSGQIIPPPEGADVKTIEGLKASIHLFQPKHFIMPFLAHALGTLVGAMIAVAIGSGNYLRLALIVAGLFFAGGFANVLMLPAPLWFDVIDLSLAYFPMGWLGYKLVSNVKK